MITSFVRDHKHRKQHSLTKIAMTSVDFFPLTPATTLSCSSDNSITATPTRSPCQRPEASRKRRQARDPVQRRRRKHAKVILQQFRIFRLAGVFTDYIPGKRVRAGTLSGALRLRSVATTPPACRSPSISFSSISGFRGRRGGWFAISCSRLWSRSGTRCVWFYFS